MKSRRYISPFIKILGAAVFLIGLLLWVYGVFLVCRLLGGWRLHGIVHRTTSPHLLGALKMVPAVAQIRLGGFGRC